MREACSITKTSSFIPSGIQTEACNLSFGSMRARLGCPNMVLLQQGQALSKFSRRDGTAAI
jgi:hypothetical protein